MHDIPVRALTAEACVTQEEGLLGGLHHPTGTGERRGAVGPLQLMDDHGANRAGEAIADRVVGPEGWPTARSTSLQGPRNYPCHPPRQGLDVRWSGRRRSPWRGEAGVASRAGELALEGREGIDDCPRLVGPVPSPDRDLTDHAGALQAAHRLVRRLEAAADELGGTADGDDGTTW